MYRWRIVGCKYWHTDRGGFGPGDFLRWIISGRDDLIWMIGLFRPAMSFNSLQFRTDSLAANDGRVGRLIDVTCVWHAVAHLF